MRASVLCLALLLLLTTGLAERTFAQDSQPPDSFQFPPGVLSPQDSVLRDRLRKVQQKEPAAPPAPAVVRSRLAIRDSIVARFRSPATSLQSQRSIGLEQQPTEWLRRRTDLLQFDYLETPYRSTAQPYGLSGRRLESLSGGFRIDSWELLPEPDGLHNLYASAGANSHQSDLLPGGLGHIVGGHGAALLWSEPERSTQFEPRMRFESDQGDFGHDFTRGSFSKRFTSGREIDFGIGYTDADGPRSGADYQSYAYDGTLYTPVGVRTGLVMQGHLFDVEGRWQSRSDLGSSVLTRKAFDRAFDLFYERYSQDRTVRRAIGYSYGRHRSHLTGALTTRDDLFRDGLHLNADQAGAATFRSLGATIERVRYETGSDEYERWTGSVSASVSSRAASPIAARAELGWVEAVGLLPSLSIAHSRAVGSAKLLVTASLQSSAPELREWHLPAQSVLLFGSSDLYEQGGNPALSEEQLAMVTADLDFTASNRSLTISMAGGFIRNGILWQYLSNNGDEQFVPRNSDQSFATASARGEVCLFERLTLFGSGAVHELHLKGGLPRPYQPALQGLVGGELHLPWKEKRIDLFAYGELVLTGPYDGYTGRPIGQTAVANSKLTFQMGSFRFFWTTRNLFNLIYEPREYTEAVGITNWWGIRWLFAD